MAKVIYDVEQLTTKLKDELKAKIRRGIEGAMDEAIREVKTELLANLPDVAVSMERIMNEELKITENRVVIEFVEK